MNSKEELDALAKLTEFEIKRIDDGKREKGWSPWLLYAALAALFWKIVGDIGNPHHWSQVAFYWAFLVMGADFLESFSHVLGRQPKGGDTRVAPRFLSANKLLGAARPYLAFITIKISLAAFIVFQSGVLTGMPQYVWTAFFGAHFIGWIVIIIISFLDLPFSVGSSRPHKAITWTVVAGFALHAAAIGLLAKHAVPMIISSYDADDFKLSLLILGICYLLKFFLSHNLTDPSRITFIQIRRAIGLGQISCDDAKAMLEIALHGVELSKFLQPEVNAYLGTLDDLNREQEATAKHLSLIQEHLAGDGNSESSTVVHALLAQAQKHAAVASTLIKTANDKITSFEQRVAYLSVLESTTEASVAQLRENMKNQLATVTKRDNELQASIAASESSAQNSAVAIVNPS